VINTIVAEVLSQISDRLEQAEDFHHELRAILKEIALNHSRIIFDGNGYSEEWVKEAEERGLPHIRSTVEAISALISDKSIQVFEKHGVFSSTELHSRYEIYLEQYSKTINIEAQTMIDMAKRQILPVVMRYATELAHSINTIGSACAEANVSTQTTLLQEISSLLKDLKDKIDTLQVATTKAKELNGDANRQGIYYRDVVFPAMNDLREVVDTLEILVDYELWPLPSYTQMLFML
jgi:glutamine synthetase